MFYPKAKNNNVEFIRLTPEHTVVGTLIIEKIDRLSQEACDLIQKKEGINIILPGKSDSDGNRVFTFLKELNFDNTCKYYQKDLDSHCIRIKRVWDNGLLEGNDIAEKETDELSGVLKYKYTEFQCKVVNAVCSPSFPESQDTDDLDRKGLPPVCSIS